MSTTLKRVLKLKPTDKRYDALVETEADIAVAQQEMHEARIRMNLAMKKRIKLVNSALLTDIGYMVQAGEGIRFYSQTGEIRVFAAGGDFYKDDSEDAKTD